MIRAIALTLVPIALLLTGCSQDNSSNAANTEQAHFRAVNLVSDSPSLDLTVERARFAALSFTQSTSLSGRTAGRYRMAVRHLPPAADETVDLVEETRVKLTAGVETTLLITGSIASTDLVILESPLEEDIADDTTEVRFFNGVAGTVGIDLYVSQDPDSTALTGLSPIALAPQEASTLRSEESGRVRLLVTATGDDELIYDSGPVTLLGGSRRLIAFIDYFGPGGSVRGLQIGPSGTSGFVEEQFPAAVRVAHMIADLDGIDMLIDGELLVDSLALGGLSDYLEIAAGTHTVSVTYEDQPLAELFTQEWPMVPGEQRTLVVAGSASTADLSGRFVLDDSRPIATGAQVRLIHAAPNLGRLDAYLLDADEALADAEPTFSNFALLGNGAGLVAPGTYQLVITQAGDAVASVGPVQVGLESSGVYTVVVADAADGSAGEIILADDFTQ